MQLITTVSFILFMWTLIFNQRLSTLSIIQIDRVIVDKLLWNIYYPMNTEKNIKPINIRHAKMKSYWKLTNLVKKILTK